MKLYILLFMCLFSLTSSAVTKNNYDFVVGVDGDFRAAKAAAEASQKSRFILFFPDGEYDIGSLTGDDNQMTTFQKGNISFVGQSMNGVVIYNTAKNENISSTATLYFNSNASNIYLQDLTLQNRGQVDPNANANRYVVVRDLGSKNIYKNVKMLSGQDTYYTPSGSTRSYLETCEIHGTVDFICGGGDLMFNKCSLILENRSNNCITAPAGTGQWGYVFLDCTIDGYPVNNNSYRLGRSWNKSPRAVYINSTMKVLPTVAGWGEPMNVVPTLFAEYNSRDANGNMVNTSQRKSNYQKDANTVYINPVLSAQDAAKYTIANVMKGDDNWDPTQTTRQVEAPTLSVNSNVIFWQDNEAALCYVVFRNGKYVANTKTTSYTIPSGIPESDTYTVRAANEMGGLGASFNGVHPGDNSGGGDPIVNVDSHLFYYGNGTLSKTGSNEFDNEWTCSDNGKTDYSWAITSRDDKSILYGTDIVYKGTSYSTFKASNGAQNTFYLPEGVNATKVTFIGYTNNADGAGVLSEINGRSTSLEMTTNTTTANYASNPTEISYTFENGVTGSFTFTFGSNQVCFVMVLEVEKVGDDVYVEDVVADLENEAQKANVSLLIYDLNGKKVEKLEPGHIYVQNGKCFVIYGK